MPEWGTVKRFRGQGFRAASHSSVVRNANSRGDAASKKVGVLWCVISAWQVDAWNDSTSSMSSLCLVPMCHVPVGTGHICLGVSCVLLCM